jgi:hypothetical protein
MIPKEIMKRGGILAHLALLKEESPYKPETFASRAKRVNARVVAHKDLQGSA